MPLGMELGFGPGHIVLDGDPAPSAPKGTSQSSPHISAHAYGGQTDGCLGTEVGLGPGKIVLDGDPAPDGKGHSSPNFSAHVYCGQTVAHLSCC